MNQNLVNLRKQIDKIDEELFNLIIRRIEVAMKIAKYKREYNLRLVDKGREKKIITKIIRLAKKKEINLELIKEIFKNIIKLTKKEMHNKNY